VNAEQLLREFDRLSEAPDAVSRCRQAILELAIQGRLTTRRSTDLPAREILDGRMLTPAPTDVAWALPSGWAWTSLRLVGEQFGGGTPSKTTAAFWNGTIPWVSPKDMKVERIADSRDHVSDAALTGSAVRLIPPGAILMVVRGMILAHSFPIALTEVPLTVNQDMKAVVPFAPDIAPILVLTLKGLKRRILTLVERSTHGTCRLPTAGLFDLPIPVPPLQEQRRIVSKVDELMTVCDELETAQEQRERRRKQLSAASLAHLTAPGDTAGRVAEKDVTFALSHSDRIVTRPDHVANVRKAILDLAVQGQLVSPSHANDEPLGELCTKITDGTHRTPTYVAAGIPFVSVKDFSGGQLDFSNTRFISKDEHRELTNRCDPRCGDVLIARIGTLGKAVVVETDREFSLFVSVGLLRPNTNKILPHFLALYLNSPTATRAYDEIKVGGGTHTNKLNLGDLKALTISTPSLDKQRRIIDKVNELMAVCDELERSLAAVEMGQARALEAVLHELLEEANAPLPVLLEVAR
jgi:type I restriction enzyme S subunit